VNRLVFEDGSDGLALVRAMKSGGEAPHTPVMLVSNFADAQARAIAERAEPGFGKAALHAPDTLDRLCRYLPRRAQDHRDRYRDAS
jgi:hypothetical protein